MAQVTVTEACELVGLSRSYFYKKYIHTGKVSVTRTLEGKPQIDTSELLRVFGEIGKDKESTPADDTPTRHEDALKIQALQLEVDHLKARLQDKDDRISDLKKSIELLEYKKEKKWFKIWG